MIDIVKPDVLWVTGSDLSEIERGRAPLQVSWKKVRSSRERVGRGKFEFCGRKLQICITPDLSGWDATCEKSQDLLRWVFKGLAV